MSDVSRPEAQAPRPAGRAVALVGSDIGGTFTDVVAFDPTVGEVSVAKVLTTAAVTDGVLQGLADAAGDAASVAVLAHGSTIVINTLLERTGARTALLTTRGFRDVYEIGRVNRPDAYNLHFRKHEPLVERRLRLEIDERISPHHRVPVDQRSVDAAVAVLRDEGVGAVAVCFLHAFADPSHERQVAETIRQALPEVFVSASHEVSREYREFERTSTVVANAYVGVRAGRYLHDLGTALEGAGFEGELRLMQSNGGIAAGDRARRVPIDLVESGPAAGVIGAAAVAADLGIGSLVAFDMGGTTAKAGVVLDGEPRLAHEYFLGGYGHGLPLQTPVMDIQEVGTGGGSIATATEYGELRVGPRSAGSDPGPAAYGLGGAHPTVTDANVVLRRLHPDVPLANGLKLDAAAAEEAIEEHVATPLGLDVHDAAAGILDIASASMANAILAVTTQRGIDPGKLALLAYGGAGPLHATQVARLCGMRSVIIPPLSGVFSAYGMLFSDRETHAARTHLTPLTVDGLDQLERQCADLVADLTAHEGEVAVQFRADLRYVGQEHTVTVPFERSELTSEGFGGFRRRFDEHHERLFLHHAADEPAEVTTVRSIARVAQPKPAFSRVGGGEVAPDPFMVSDAVLDRRCGPVATPYYHREDLGALTRIDGPAIVVEATSATVLMPGDQLEVHEHGALQIRLGVVRSPA